MSSITDSLLYRLAEEEFINSDAQASIKAAFADKKNVDLYSYARQNHAFARPSGSHYDAAAVSLTNKRTEKFSRNI